MSRGPRLTLVGDGHIAREPGLIGSRHRKGELPRTPQKGTYQGEMLARSPDPDVGHAVEEREL